MTIDTRRELRLLGVIAIVFALYALATVGLAATHGQLELVRFRVGDSLVSLLRGAFALMGVAYLVDLIVRRRPAHPLRAVVADARAQVAALDLMAARVTIVVAFVGLMMLFSPFKIMIANIQGFPWDQDFAAIDRALFFGIDPWRLTHAIFGPAGSYLIQVAYNLWFAMLWFSLVYLMARPGDVRRRAHYVLAFHLSWIVVGSFAALAFSSAGPCFYERAFGDPTFAPLMARLADIEAQIKGAGLPFGALDLQDGLWKAYTKEQALFGGGISAMPSVHVAIAVVMALGGYSMRRRLGHALAGFAFVIWIGSIHLGWHYAIDGIVSLALVLATWKASGAIVDRYVMAERPAFRLAQVLRQAQDERVLLHDGPATHSTRPEPVEGRVQGA